MTDTEIVGAEDDSLWERRYKAVTLRNAGVPYPDVAKKLNVSVQTVRNDVGYALRRLLTPTVEELVARQRSVLLDLQRAAYPKALKGDATAIASVLRVLDQEAKLLGLNAPARVDVGLSDAEFNAQVASLIASLRPDTVAELVRTGTLEPHVLALVSSEVAEKEAAKKARAPRKRAGRGGRPRKKPASEPEVIDAEVVEEEAPEQAELPVTDGWSNL